MNNILSIPNEIKNLIFSYPEIDAESRQNLSLASKKLYDYFHNGKIWQSLKLPNFLTNDKLQTVQQILKLEPKDPKAISLEDEPKRCMLRAVKATLMEDFIKKKDWEWALMHALDGKRKDIVEILLHDAQFTTDNWSLFFDKCKDDSMAEIAEILLKHCHSHGIIDSPPVGKFKSAIKNEQFKLAAVLCSVVGLDDVGEALKSAIKNNQLEFAKSLIKNQPRVDGSDALIYAAENCPENVKFLLDSGLNALSRSTAVCYAAEKGHFGFMEELLQKGPILITDWCQALKQVIEREDLASAKVLLKHRPTDEKEKIASTLDKLVKSLMNENKLELAEVLMGKDGEAKVAKDD